mgnify:CR=1 FL=1
MANKTSIHSDAAPKALGPYSQAVRAGDTLYLSGQLGLDPQTMELVAGGIDSQAKQVFENWRQERRDGPPNEQQLPEKLNQDHG